MRGHWLLLCSVVSAQVVQQNNPAFFSTQISAQQYQQLTPYNVQSSTAQPAAFAQQTLAQTSANTQASAQQSSFANLPATFAQQQQQLLAAYAQQTQQASPSVQSQTRFSTQQQQPSYFAQQQQPSYLLQQQPSYSSQQQQQSQQQPSYFSQQQPSYFSQQQLQQSFQTQIQQQFGQQQQTQQSSTSQSFPNYFAPVTPSNPSFFNQAGPTASSQLPTASSLFPSNPFGTSTSPALPTSQPSYPLPYTAARPQTTASSSTSFLRAVDQQQASSGVNSASPVRRPVVQNISTSLPPVVVPPISLYVPRNSSRSSAPFSNPATVLYVPRNMTMRATTPLTNPTTTVINPSGPSGSPLELYGRSPSQLPTARQVANPLTSGGRPSVVSFDFDGTLQDNPAGGGVGAPYPQVIALLKQYAQQGARVVIVTQRDVSDNGAIENFLRQYGLSQYVSQIYNSETGDKTKELLQAGAQIHIDDRITNLQTLTRTLPQLQLFAVLNGVVIPYPSGFQ